MTRPKQTETPQADMRGFRWSSAELVVGPPEESAVVPTHREVLIRKLQEEGSIGPDEAFELTTGQRSLEDVADRVESLNEEDFRRFRRDHLRFNREAALNAHLDFRSRFAVTFVAPDEIGVLAALTRRLTDRGCSIEAATMMVIADQVATMLIVSGSSLLTASDLDAALAEHPAESVPAPHVEPLRAAEPEWPRPDSVNWNMYAEVEDEPGTLWKITHEIAKAGVPLTAFATYVTSDGKCALDLNYAVPPGVDSEALAEALRSIVKDPVPRVRPAARPLHGVARSYEKPRVGKAVVLTVLGIARPGLVEKVTRGLKGDEGHPAFNIVVSAMAILEGYTALALVVEPFDDAIESDLVREAETAAGRFIQTEEFEARVANAYMLPAAGRRGAPSHIPTHHLSFRAEDGSGVLDEIASGLATAGANIVWVMARVLEWSGPQGTKAWFDLRLDLSIPAGKVAGVEKYLTEMRAMLQWNVLLRPWGDLPADRGQAFVN